MNKHNLTALLLILALFWGISWQSGQAQSRRGPPPGISSLKVRAHPLKAVTSRQDQQTIYIIVQDQNLMPVPGVEVSLRLQMPDGEEQLYIVIQPTDQTGITQTSFPVSVEDVGLVIVAVHAVRDRLEARTSTSFRVWW